MNEDELLSQLTTELSSTQRSEARGVGDAAVAKTAAIKNIQKALTAKILKKLDDGQPLVCVKSAADEQKDEEENKINKMKFTRKKVRGSSSQPKRKTHSCRW
jgi:hypothetical protein